MSETVSPVLSRPELSDTHRNFDTTFEAVAPPISRSILPQTSLEFRQVLGLPEPSEVSAEAAFEAKKNLVEGYVAEQTAATPLNQFAYHLETLDYEDGEIKKQLADHSVSARLWRGYMTKRLSWAGIKQAGELLQTIEKSVRITDRKYLKPATLVRLIKTLDSVDETTAIKKFNLAAARAREFYLVPESWDFKHYQNELIDFINVLANTSEDTFQKITGQFKGRTTGIIQPYDFCSGLGKSENNGLLQIIQQGGLTPNQQEILNKAVSWRKFAGTLPFKKERPGSAYDHGSNYEFGLEYGDLLNPEIGRQIEKFYPYLIDYAADQLVKDSDGKTVIREIDTCNGADFTVGIQHLYSTGKLAYLKELIDAGWNCRGIYEAMGSVGQTEKVLTQATAFQINPEKVAWAKAFEEYFYGNHTLAVSRIDFYELMIRNKDALIKTALALNSFPHREGFKPGTVLTSENGEINIDRDELVDILEHLAGKEGIAEPEINYFKGVVNLLRNKLNRYVQPGNLPQHLSAEELSFCAYIATHKDRLAGQMFNEEGYAKVDAALINEFTQGKVPVETQFMRALIAGCYNPNSLSPSLKLAYFDCLGVNSRVEVLITLPDEFLATLPPGFQKSVTFFKGLPGNLQIAVIESSKEYFLRYIENGQPTAAFAELALDRGWFQDARQFLTAEILSSFPPEKQQFFKACLNLPPEITSLMQWKIAEWPNYFVDSKPTAAFLSMVARAELGGGKIDRLLATADLTHLPPETQTFWNYYKSIPEKPYMRTQLTNKPYKFSEFVVNGQPTVAFLEDMASSMHYAGIKEVLGFIKTAELPADQRPFWEFYPSVDQKDTFIIRNFLLQHRDQFAQLIKEGKPTLSFLNQVVLEKDGNFNPVLIQQILSRIDQEKMPPEDKAFWQYYSSRAFNQNGPSAVFLLNNKDQFPQMVTDGQEMPLFYQMLVVQEPQTMLKIAQDKPDLSAKQYQDLWRMAVGRGVIDKFLAALPKVTDEARNAFTGNDYDRTSQFIQYLYDRNPSGQFALDAANFSMMTDYIRQFGMARNETVYKYYRALRVFELQQITDLPEEMKALGITSTAEMVQKFVEVRKMVFAEKPLTDPAQLRVLTPFQIKILANVTRFDSARFGAGDTDSLAWKINGFAQELENSLITPLPPGYQTESIEASSIKIEFNADAIRKDYEILKGEILECIDKPLSVEQLKLAVKAIAERRIGKINDTLGRVTNEKAKAVMERDLSNNRSFVDKLEQVKDVDSLVLSLLGMNFSNEDRSGGEGFTGIDSILRRIVLAKLYQKHTESPGFLENVRIKLAKDEITAEGIDEIILTVDEMVKNHVLNLDLKNKEKFWQPEVFQEIIANDFIRKSFRRVIERFNPHAEKLRQEQARFVKTQTGKVSEIKIVPDRGFIGEMSGYLADVCYVRVADLLKTYSGLSPEQPMVVPYKFVIDSTESDDPRFVGSVLVFEVETATGEPALLVRALDIPNEGEIDTSKFIENLLDKFAKVAKKRGKKKVLVAGTPSTISNYASTTSYVIGKYVTGKEPEPVSPDFDFNHYNITNAIYTARTI